MAENNSNSLQVHQEQNQSKDRLGTKSTDNILSAQHYIKIYGIKSNKKKFFQKNYVTKPAQQPQQAFGDVQSIKKEENEIILPQIKTRPQAEHYMEFKKRGSIAPARQSYTISTPQNNFLVPTNQSFDNRSQNNGYEVYNGQSTKNKFIKQEDDESPYASDKPAQLYKQFQMKLTGGHASQSQLTQYEQNRQKSNTQLSSVRSQLGGKPQYFNVPKGKVLTSAYLCKPQAKKSPQSKIPEYNDVDSEYRLQAEKRIKEARAKNTFQIKQKLNKAEVPIKEESSRYQNRNSVKKSRNAGIMKSTDLISNPLMRENKDDMLIMPILAETEPTIIADKIEKPKLQQKNILQKTQSEIQRSTDFSNDKDIVDHIEKFTVYKNRDLKKMNSNNVKLQTNPSKSSNLIAVQQKTTSMKNSQKIKPFKTINNNKMLQNTEKISLNQLRENTQQKIYDRLLNNEPLSSQLGSLRNQSMMSHKSSAQKQLEQSETKRKKKKFKIEDFEWIKLLGQGSFGIVKLVKHKKTRKFYAVKCLSKGNILGKKQIQHIQNERDILSMFKVKDFCCNLYESLQDEFNLYMVIDFLPGGELIKVIKSNVFMSEADTKFYIAEIVLGVEKLHDMNIIYRDLKPENVLLDEEGHIKLIDFGFAKRLNDIRQDRAYTNCGTPGYCAPEVMLDLGHTYKADLWSIGILICEMIGGFTPFQNKNEASNPKLIMEKCRSGQLNLPKNLKGNTRDLVKLLLIDDPVQRLEISQMKDHSFFRGLDWMQLKNRQIEPPFRPELYRGYYEQSPFENNHNEDIIFPKKLNFELHSNSPGLPRDCPSPLLDQHLEEIPEFEAPIQLTKKIISENETISNTGGTGEQDLSLSKKKQNSSYQMNMINKAFIEF